MLKEHEWTRIKHLITLMVAAPERSITRINHCMDDMPDDLRIGLDALRIEIVNGGFNTTINVLTDASKALIDNPLDDIKTIGRFLSRAIQLNKEGRFLQ